MAALISKDDFRRIRLSLALAVILMLAGGAIVFASLQLLDAEKKSNREALAKRNEIQKKLMRARDEEQEIKQKIARFQELGKRGIIGDEQRLDWVEQIRQIKTARKLFDMQYEISPQRPLDGAVAPGTGGDYEFLASMMQLKIQLLHEEDLLNFLSDLRGMVHAHIRVKDCSVERLPKSQGDRGGKAAPQLQAECTIDWITLRQKKGA